MKMHKNRKTGIAICGIAFILSVFLLFVIPAHISNGVYLTLLFDVIAYVSSLVLCITIFRTNKNTKRDILCLASNNLINYLSCNSIRYLYSGGIAGRQNIITRDTDPELYHNGNNVVFDFFHINSKDSRTTC